MTDKTTDQATVSLPASFAQQRLWLFQQLMPDSPAYNIAFGLALSGVLDVAALQQSLSAIVARHEPLRTTFTAVDGEPFQVIAAPAPLSLTEIDLRAMSPAARAAEVERISLELARTRFDLQRGPLFQATLLHLEQDERLLILSMHHIVADGWSSQVLMAELETLYAAYAQRASDAQPELAELPIQYADYSAWQREQLQNGLLEPQLAYWKTHLQGVPVLELPTDRPRPPLQTFQGDTEIGEYPPALYDRLMALSRQEGTTLFMTGLAAFATLLYRYTGQRDVVIGSPVAGRTHSDLQQLVGMFVNMLVLRNDLHDNPSFRELLQRVRTTTLAAYEHQDTPFDKLVELLQPQRDASHTSLFQVMFTVQAAPSPPSLPQLSVSHRAIPNQTAKFDLLLTLEEGPRSLQAIVDYSSDLFDATTIRRLIGHYRTLLEAIVADPDQRVADLPLLTAAERQQILVDWNQSAADLPIDNGIHQLFEAQAARTPDALAATFEGASLRYAELNARANRLAHYLRRHGVGPEVQVGIYMERSLEMVVSLLAILKAGGAYLPLDPAYPAERVAFMIRDSQIRLALTQDRHSAGLAESGLEIVRVDQLPQLADESDQNPTLALSPANLAYVIYTSGSTGNPKGAMLHHRGICNRLLWGIRDYQLGPGDRVLSKTPISFDVSVWEIFAPLLSGAAIVIARPGGEQDSAYLAQLIRDERVTHADFVPSMLHLFLQEPALERNGSLKRITAAGEALTIELQQRFFDRLNADLYNLYGPTEASLAVTYWNCERDNQRRTIPIGRPMSNARIYILDAQLQPTPVGVAGELYIGGVPVGRGYFKRPDLTATKFIPDPFSEEPGARLYRTGDLTRYLPDGNIEFLGRIDQQVKLRGFRIELEEIEVALSRHPAVQDAAVLVREDTPGDQRLVAYVVARTESAEQRTEGPEPRAENQEPTEAEPGSQFLGLGSPSASELRRFLRDRLPEYMVPAAFVLLPAFPLTPNGKLDRKALPAPDTARPDQEDAFVAPTTPLEEVLAAIWSDVLHVEQIGIHDNFFELGGHSLLATKVIAQVREFLKVDLPLRTLFRASTVAGLAQALLEDPQHGSRVARVAELLLELAAPADDEDEQLSPGAA